MFGSEFNAWEWDLLKNFNQAKKAGYVTISGAVVANQRLGRGQFLLIPAPHLPQDQILCVCLDLPIPPNGQYITVRGKNTWVRDHHEVVVYDIKPAEMKIPIKPEIKFEDFQDSLLLQWSGLESPLRELLAFQFVSCPPLFALGQAGGLVISTYDGTQAKRGKMLLRYFKNLMPPEILMGKPCSVEVPWMGVKMRALPFSWQYKTIDADKPLSSALLGFLSDRKSAFSEVSVSLGTDKKGPASIYDAPLNITDQPTLLRSTLEKRPINVDPPLEIVKYITTQQMFYPVVGGEQEDFMQILNQTSAKIIKVAESYDVPLLVRRHGLFDPNYYGKPASVLRVALASARASCKPKVDGSWVVKAFDEYCLENMKWILDSWRDYVTSKGVETVSLGNELDRQMLRFITDTEIKEAGAGFDIIEEHFFNRNELELRQSIRRLLDLGKIREERQDVFRSVGLE
jgi:hypothetical protein